MLKAGRYGLLGVATFLFMVMSIFILHRNNIAGAISEESQVGFESLSFYVHTGKQVQEIDFWADDTDDICYVFLPSYAEKSLIISLAPGYYIESDQNILRNNKSYENYSYDTLTHFRMYNEVDELVAEKDFVFMKSENISAMFIQTESQSLEYIHEDKANKESGTMQLINENGKLLYSNQLSIKGRGNTTWVYEKKPYNIELSVAADLLGINKHATKWSLIANVLDRSHIRNRITHKMAEEAGMAFTPQMTHVDLYINNEYYGLYQLTERVEVDSDKVDISALEEETYRVNEQEAWQNMQPFAVEEDSRIIRKGYEIENNPEDISGGYLLVRDFYDRYEEEGSGFITKNDEPIIIKSPKRTSAEQVDYISSLVQEFEDAINEKDGINPDTGKAYTEYIDMESWIKKYLIEEISLNSDAGLASQYFYKPVDSVSDLLYAGPVWDYDRTYAFRDSAPHNIVQSLYCIQYEKAAKYSYSSSWYTLLYEKEDFYEGIVKEYEETFVPIIEELLETDIEQYKSEIMAASRLDACRWKIGKKEDSVVREGRVEEQVDLISDFLHERVQFLNSIWLLEEEYNIVSLMVERNTAERNIYYYLKDGEVLGELPVVEREGKEFIGWVYEGTEEFFDPEQPITEDITLCLLWEKSPVESESDTD